VHRSAMRHVHHPEKQVKIIAELAVGPILPILQTMSRAPFHGHQV
jgi:hypothetical protein